MGINPLKCTAFDYARFLIDSSQLSGFTEASEYVFGFFINYISKIRWKNNKVCFRYREDHVIKKEYI